MNAQGVREVHPFARVKLFDDFAEILSVVLLSIREDAVFHSSVEDLSMVVSILSAWLTSLRTILQISSLLEISSCIPGANILP